MLAGIAGVEPSLGGYSRAIVLWVIENLRLLEDEQLTSEQLDQLKKSHSRQRHKRSDQ